MSYFRSPDYKVHWLDSDAFIHLLPEGSVQINDEEANVLRAQPPAIPSIVSMRQARLALLQSSLLDQVESAISTGNQVDQITWEYAAEVRREDPLVTNLSAALGLTSQQLDNLFVLAAAL